jgi:hypothetical protein
MGRRELVESLPARVTHWTTRQRISALHVAMARNLDERNRAGLARLEADGRTCGNVEPAAIRGRAIEVERAIRLGEVIVTPHLNRPIAQIRHGQIDRDAARIDLDLAILDEEFAGCSAAR